MTIDGLKNIAEFLGISMSKLCRMKAAGLLDSVLLTRKQRIICANGKPKIRRIYYSRPEILRTWEHKRGGLNMYPVTFHKGKIVIDREER